MATVIHHEKPAFDLPFPTLKEWLVWQMGEESLFAIEFEVPRGRNFEYSCLGKSFHVHIPAKGQSLHIALSSCNGYEDEDLDNPNPKRSAAWHKMMEMHKQQPYHLMLQMGDQIYNDQVWSCHPELEAWQGFFPLTRYRYPFSQEMLDATERFYWGHYSAQRRLPYLSLMQASVPSLMMWDDHDIFDGYGSYRGYDSHSEVFEGVFSVAKKAFESFQTPQYSWEFQAGNRVILDKLGILMPDLRSLRTRRNVLGARGLAFLKDSLKAMQDCKHLIVVMTVPFVNISLSIIERIMVMIPGQQLYQDDLRDQWRSYAHRDEWLQLAQLLFDFQKQSQCDVNLFSGEIHLGGKGLLKKDQETITQYISPGIAHPPPPQKLIHFLNFMAKKKENVGGFEISMQKLRPDSYYAPQNGFLDFELNGGQSKVEYVFVQDGW